MSKKAKKPKAKKKLKPRVPSVSGKKACKAFAKHGFSLDRVSGSHHILRKPGYKYVLSMPVHGSKPVRKGTLTKLIKAAGITIPEFIDGL